MTTIYRADIPDSQFITDSAYHFMSEENIDPSVDISGYATTKKALPHLKGQRQYQSGVLEPSPIPVNQDLHAPEEQKTSPCNLSLYSIVGTQNTPAIQSKVGLDIDSVPRPNLIPEENTVKGIRYTTKIEQGFPSPPPSTVTRHYSIDEGNSIPRMFRCSLEHIPTDGEVLFGKGAFPFGVIAQPFAELSEYDTPVPLSNYGGEKLLRCKRCGAYVNPKFTFTGGGSQIVCNICGVATPASVQEVAIGEQSDRIELLRGTCDFMAPQILNGKTVTGNNFVLVIECTQNAINFGKHYS